MISENLPYNWHAAAFGDVLADISNGIPAPQNKESIGIPVSRIETIAAGKVNLSKIGYVSNVDEVEAERYLLAPGDILFSHINSPTHIGKTAIFRSGKLYHGTNLLRIKTERSVCTPEYFEYYCRYFRSVGEFSINAQHAVNQSSLNQKKIKAFLLPLAPLAEQTRIAAKLDELLAQVDTLKARIDGIPALLKRFRQSVLAAAVSGRLSEDWRVQHSLAEWRISTFGDEGAVSGGLTKNAKRSELTLEKPYLRVANVHANKLSLGDVTHIGLTDKEFEKTRLLAGDILIVEGNGSLEHIGRAAIWNDEIPDCSHQNHLIRWRPIGGMQPRFALYQLLSPQGRKQLIEVAKSTTGLHTLSISKVSALVLPAPEEDEQTEIVRRVEQLFAFADQLEARIGAAQTRIDRLTQSILAKAFRGELVPQDPNDEPASVMLERIKAQRAAAPKAKRGRRAATLS